VSTTTFSTTRHPALGEAAVALEASPRSRRSLSICHLSPVQDRLDSRTYVMEMLPLAKRGCELTLIGAHGHDKKETNVEFVSTPKRQTRIKRILLAMGLALRALRRPAHLYHIHNPEMIPAGLILKWFAGKKVVYDTQEDHPSMMLTKTYLPPSLRRLARRIVASIERLASREFDGFIAADSGTLRATARVGRSRKLVFYNLPNLDFFPSPEANQKTFDLVYRGGLSERAGTFVMLAAVRELTLRGMSPRLLLFGYADRAIDRARIQKHIEGIGLASSVVLAGRIDHSKMAETLSKARISICPLMEIPKFKNNIPVKVFESWACGLPVICSDLPPIRPFFKGKQFGLLVEPGNVMALADAMERLLANPEEATRMGTAGRKAVVDQYNNSSESKKLLAFYKKLLSNAV
jgi:glycosyltransferase involved in cell wall biosynthesis